MQLLLVGGVILMVTFAAYIFNSYFLNNDSGGALTGQATGTKSNCSVKQENSSSHLDSPYTCPVLYEEVLVDCSHASASKQAAAKIAKDLCEIFFNGGTATDPEG